VQERAGAGVKRMTHIISFNWLLGGVSWIAAALPLPSLRRLEKVAERSYHLRVVSESCELAYLTHNNTSNCWNLERKTSFRLTHFYRFDGYTIDGWVFLRHILNTWINGGNETYLILYTMWTLSKTFVYKCSYKLSL